MLWKVSVLHQVRFIYLALMPQSKMGLHFNIWSIEDSLINLVITEHGSEWTDPLTLHCKDTVPKI
jgi:hypothetical protein